MSSSDLNQTGTRPPAPSLDLNALLHRGPLYVKTMLLPGRRAWVNRHVMLLSHSLEWYADSSMSTVVGSVSLLGATAILAPPKSKSSVPSSAASVSSTGSGGGHASPSRGGIDRSELVFELEWPEKGEFLPLRATSPEQFTIWIQALLQSSASVSFDLVQKSGAVVKSGLNAGVMSLNNIQEQGVIATVSDVSKGAKPGLETPSMMANSFNQQMKQTTLPHSFSETHHTEGSHTALYHATELLSGPMYILVANEGASLRLASEAWMPRFAMLESATVDGSERPDESGSGSILRLYEQLSESDLRESEMILISNSRSEFVPPRANNPPDTNCFVITVRSGRQVFLATPVPGKYAAAGTDRERPPTREQWIAILNSNSQATRNRPIPAASNDGGGFTSSSALSITSQSNSVSSDVNPAEKNLPPHLRRKKGLAAAAAAVMLVSKNAPPVAAPVQLQEPALDIPEATPFPIVEPIPSLQQDITMPNNSASIEEPIIDLPPLIDTERYQLNEEYMNPPLTSRNDDDTLESYTDRNREDDEEEGGLTTTEGGDLRDLLDENFDSISTAGGYVPGSGASTYPNSHRGSISASGLPPGTSTNDVVMYLTQRVVSGNFARQATSAAPASASAPNLKTAADNNDHASNNHNSIYENPQPLKSVPQDEGAMMIAETPQSPESVVTYASGFISGSVGKDGGGGGGGAILGNQKDSLIQQQNTFETRASTAANNLRDGGLRSVIASATAALNASNFERGRDTGGKTNSRYSVVPPVEEVEDEEQLTANEENDGPSRNEELQPGSSSARGFVEVPDNTVKRRGLGAQPLPSADLRSAHDKLIANAARATSTLLSMHRALTVSTPLISQLPLITPTNASVSNEANSSTSSPSSSSSSSSTSISSPSHALQQPAYMKRLNRNIVLPSSISSPSSIPSTALADTATATTTSSSPVISLGSYVPPSLLAASSPSLIFEKFKARRIGITPQASNSTVSNLSNAVTVPHSIQQTLSEVPSSEEPKTTTSSDGATSDPSVPELNDQQVGQSEPEQEKVPAQDVISSTTQSASPSKELAPSPSPSVSSSSPRRPMEPSSAVALGIVASGNLPLPPSPWAGRRAVERFVATELTALSTALATALSPEALGTLASVPLPDAQAPDDAREETAAKSIRDEFDESLNNGETKRPWENIWSIASSNAPITAAEDQQKSAISGAISRAAAAGFAIQGESFNSSSNSSSPPLSSFLPLSPRAKSDLSLLLSSIVCASSGYTLNKEAAAELQPVLPDAGNSGPVHLQLDAATAQRISSRVARTLHADAIWRTAPSKEAEKEPAEPAIMVEEEQQTEDILTLPTEVVTDFNNPEIRPAHSPIVPQRAAPPVPSTSPSLILSASALSTAHKNALFSFYLEYAPSKATVENVDGIWNSYSVALWPKLAEKYGTENVAKYAPPPYNSLLPATSTFAARNDDKIIPRKISTSPVSASVVSLSPSTDRLLPTAKESVHEEANNESITAAATDDNIVESLSVNIEKEKELSSTTPSIYVDPISSEGSVLPAVTIPEAAASTLSSTDIDVALVPSSSSASDTASIAAAAVAALGDPDLSFLASPSRRTFRNRRRLSSSSSSSAPAAPTSVLQSPSFLLAMKILNSADDEEAPTGALPVLSKESGRGDIISTLPAISSLPPVITSVPSLLTTDKSAAEEAKPSPNSAFDETSAVEKVLDNENSTTTANNEVIIAGIVEDLVSTAAASWKPMDSSESIEKTISRSEDVSITSGPTTLDTVTPNLESVDTSTSGVLEATKVKETASPAHDDVSTSTSVDVAAATIPDSSTADVEPDSATKTTFSDAQPSDTTSQVAPEPSFENSSSQSSTIVVTPPKMSMTQSSTEHNVEAPSTTSSSSLPPPPLSLGWAFADPSRVAAKFIPPPSTNSASSTAVVASPITQRLIGASVVVISVDTGPTSPIAGLIRLVTLVDTKRSVGGGRGQGGDIRGTDARDEDNISFEYIIGVELDTPSGSSDGSNNGFLYFECEGNTSVGARPGSSASLPYAVFIPITVQVSGAKVVPFSSPLPAPTPTSVIIASSSTSSLPASASTPSVIQPIVTSSAPMIAPREAQVVRFDESSFATSSSTTSSSSSLSSSISTSTSLSNPIRAAIDSESAADAAEPRSVMAYDANDEVEEENIDEEGNKRTSTNKQRQQRSVFLLRNGARSYAAANLARLSSAPAPPLAPAAPSPSSATALQTKRPPWNKSVITPWRRVDVKEKLLLSSLDNPIAEGLSMNVMFSSSDKRGPMSPSSSTASQLMSRPSGKMPLLATQPNLAMSQTPQQLQAHPPIPDIDADVDARVVAWLDAIMLPHAAIPIAESIALAKFYASAMMQANSSQMFDAAADGKVLVVPVNLSDVAALQGPEIAALPGLTVADAVKLGEAVVALRVIVPTGAAAQKTVIEARKNSASVTAAAIDSEIDVNVTSPDTTAQSLPAPLTVSSGSKTPHQIEDARRLQSLPPLSPSSFNLPASSSASYKQAQKAMPADALTTSSTSLSLSPTTLSPAAADAESRLLPWELEKLSREREKEKSILAAAASSSVRSLQVHSQVSPQQAQFNMQVSQSMAPYAISSKEIQREHDSVEDKEGLIAPGTPSSSSSVTVGQIANFATEAALKRAQKALAASRNTSTSTPRFTSSSLSTTSSSVPSSAAVPPPQPPSSSLDSVNNASNSSSTSITSTNSSSKPLGEGVFAAAAAAAARQSSKVSAAAPLKPASPRNSNVSKRASMSPSRSSTITSALSPRRRGNEKSTVADIELPGGVVVSASSVIEAGVALTQAQLNALLGDDSKEKQEDGRLDGGEANSSKSSPRTLKEIRASSRHVVPSHIVPGRARSKSSATSAATNEVSSSENVRPSNATNRINKSDSSSSSVHSRKSSTEGGSGAGLSPKKQKQSQQTSSASRRQSSVDEKRVSFSESDTAESTSSSSPSKKSSSTSSAVLNGKNEEGGVGGGGGGGNSFRPDLKAATAHVGDPSRGQDRDRLRKLLSGRSLIPRPAGISASGAATIVSSSSAVTEQASPVSLILPAPRSPPRSVPPRSPEPILADIHFTDVDAALVSKLKEIHMVPYAPQFGLFGFGTIDKAKSLTVEELNKKLSIPMADARRIKALFN